jgi:metal transporter CNNM
VSVLGPIDGPASDECSAEDEVTIISAVLELSETCIKDIMTPIEDVYTLSADQVMDRATVETISQQGYSRVPVWEHDPSNFVGMLLIKKLISYDPDDAKPVRDLPLSILPEADGDMNCLQALNFFQVRLARK